MRRCKFKEVVQRVTRRGRLGASLERCTTVERAEKKKKKMYARNRKADENKAEQEYNRERCNYRQPRVKRKREERQWARMRWGRVSAVPPYLFPQTREAQGESPVLGKPSS
jgi:DNA-directed RNA polymerase